MASRLLDPTTTTIHYVTTHDVLVDTGLLVQAGDVRRVPLGRSNNLEPSEQRKYSAPLILQFAHESSFVVSWERATTNSQWGADEMLS